MIILKSTTEILELISDAAANIDYSVSYADITTTTFNPSSSEGKLTTATTAIIVAAPTASTQRQIKLITISNRPASVVATIVIKKDVAGAEYNLTPAMTLQPGESVVYIDGEGWTYYSSTGHVKQANSAAGTNGHLQINSNSTLAGEADATWDPTTNELAITGNDSNILLKGITNEPSMPDRLSTHIYSKAVVGKMQLKIKGPSGLDTPLQASLWTNNTVYWTPAAVPGVFQGTLATYGGTQATGAIALTNLYTVMRRVTFASIVTTADQQVGIRTENMFFRGTVAGLGGFLFVCRFGFTTWTAGNRLFVGLSTTALTVAVQPSTLTNTIGFTIDAGDTAITFYHNDSTGGVKETIPGQPALANNNGYDAYIWCAPNGSTIYYRLDDVLTGKTLIDTSITAKIPSPTAYLTAMCVMGNAANTASASLAVIGVNRIYIETDR